MTSMEPVTKFRTTTSSVKVKAKNIHLGLMHDRENIKSVILWQPVVCPSKDTCSYMVYGVKSRHIPNGERKSNARTERVRHTEKQTGRNKSD